MKNLDLKCAIEKLSKVSIILIGCVTIVYFLSLEGIILYESGISNILGVVKDKEILMALVLSLFTATISSILGMMLIIALSFLYMTSKKYVKIGMKNIFNCINSIPPIVIGLAILLIFGKKYLGGFTDYLGIEILFTKLAIIVAQVAVILPMGFMEYINIIDSVDERYITTARGYGGSDYFIFFKIILPETLKNIKSIVVLMWSKAIGHFGAVVMVVGVTRFDTEVLSSSVFLNISCGDFTKSLASASLMIIISNIVSLLISKERLV